MLNKKQFIKEMKKSGYSVDEHDYILDSMYVGYAFAFDGILRPRTTPNKPNTQKLRVILSNTTHRFYTDDGWNRALVAKKYRCSRSAVIPRWNYDVDKDILNYTDTKLEYPDCDYYAVYTLKYLLSADDSFYIETRLKGKQNDW